MCVEGLRGTLHARGSVVLCKDSALDTLQTHGPSFRTEELRAMAVYHVIPGEC